MYTLHLKLKPSLFLTLFAVLFYIAVMMCVFMIHMLWEIESLFITLLIAHCIYILATYTLLLRAKSNVEVIQDDSGQWFLINKRGQIYKAAIRGDSVITRTILILNFTVESHHGFSTLLIARDSLDYQSFRRALVSLRGH